MTESESKTNNTRKRTNILRKYEASTISFLCSIMPSWITSDILTFIGFSGSIVIVAGLYLGNENKVWLLLSILGYAITWFGDSLDGRLAYYRNIPRKWYGWALDISVDWVSLGVMGVGYYMYFDDYKILAFIFIFAYGGSMINSLLKYKITDQYSIDTFLMGPTEVRILICTFLFLEIFFGNSLVILATVGSIVLIGINTADLWQILKMGDTRDILEKSKKL